MANRPPIYFAMQSFFKSDPPPLKRLVFRVASLYGTPVAAIAIIDALFPDNDFTFIAILGAMFLVVALVIGCVVCTIWCVRFAFGGAWAHAAITAILPLATVLSSGSLYFELYDAGQYVHFLAHKPSYDRQIANMAQNGPKIVEFNWGGILFASDGVVFDESDEIALPDGKRAAWWTKREKQTDLMCDTDSLVSKPVSVGDHYYLAGFGC